MQSHQAPTFTETRAVKGDPATRRFGIAFLTTLALLTLAVVVGIGIGNVAHYSYFSVYDQANLKVNFSDWSAFM